MEGLVCASVCILTCVILNPRPNWDEKFTHCRRRANRWAAGLQETLYRNAGRRVGGMATWQVMIGWVHVSLTKSPEDYVNP